VWVLKTVCPVAMVKRNVIIKLSKRFLERVRPKTEADSEMQPKLERQAHTCGNAKLYTGFLFFNSIEVISCLGAG
jgi:hypothetical protein